MKQWLTTFEWWPTWFPLQSTTLSPISVKGCTTLFSKIKQCSPIFAFRQTIARGLMKRGRIALSLERLIQARAQPVALV